MKKRFSTHRLALWAFILFQLASNSVNSQDMDLFITYVRGNILREKGGKAIQEGQVISSKEKINYAGGDGFLIAISTGARKARYKISRPVAKTETKGSESWELVALSLHLLWETPSLVSRSDDFPPLEVEFQTDSTINPKMLFGPLNKYLFEAAHYPIDEQHYFFLQQQHRGKVESETLSTHKDTLLVTLEIISKLQEHLGGDPGVYFLGYFNKATNKATRVAAFDPALDREGALANMVRAVAKALGPESGRKEIFNESYSEASYFLGKPSRITLMEMINGLR